MYYWNIYVDGKKLLRSLSEKRWMVFDYNDWLDVRGIFDTLYALLHTLSLYSYAHTVLQINL